MFLIQVADDDEFRYVRNNRSHQQLTGIELEDLKRTTPDELLGGHIAGRVEFDARKAEMLGWSPADFAHYEDFTRLPRPDDYERVMEAMRQHLSADTERYDTQYRIRQRDGRYIWFRHIWAVVEREVDGRPASVAGIVVDISERRCTTGSRTPCTR
jgi:PAS domain S-box-containing protein